MRFPFVSFRWGLGSATVPVAAVGVPPTAFGRNALGQRPKAWSLDISGSASRPIPKGLEALSPGLRGTSYPGLPAIMEHNPERVESNPRGFAMPSIEPFQGSSGFRQLTQGSSSPRNPGLNDCHPDGMALIRQQETSKLQRTPQRGVPTYQD